MRTNQSIYFVLLIVAALIWIKFGFHPLLLVAAAIILLALWSRLRHPRVVWKGDGYSVTVKRDFREEAWLLYHEAGHALWLRAAWAGAKEELQLSVMMDEKVYFPPDYQNALSASRIAEIQGRISEGLTHLKIRHAFTQTGQTTFT